MRSPGNQPSQSNSLLSSFATPTPGGVVLPFLGKGLSPPRGEWNTARQGIFQTRLVLGREVPAARLPPYSPRVCEAITCSTPVYVLVFTCGQQGSRNLRGVPPGPPPSAVTGRPFSPTLTKYATAAHPARWGSARASGADPPTASETH